MVPPSARSNEEHNRSSSPRSAGWAAAATLAEFWNFGGLLCRKARKLRRFRTPTAVRQHPRILADYFLPWAEQVGCRKQVRLGLAYPRSLLCRFVMRVVMRACPDGTGLSERLLRHKAKKNSPLRQFRLVRICYAQFLVMRQREARITKVPRRYDGVDMSAARDPRSCSRLDKFNQTGKTRKKLPINRHENIARAPAWRSRRPGR